MPGAISPRINGPHPEVDIIFIALRALEETENFPHACALFCAMLAFLNDCVNFPYQGVITNGNLKQQMPFELHVRSQ